LLLWYYFVLMRFWEKINRLTPIRRSRRTNNFIWLILCECDCWNTCEVQIGKLNSWAIKSCWCFRKDRMTTHWMGWTRPYKIWYWIKRRCNNPNNISYERYWGRNISYDPKRETFQWFREDMEEWYSDGLTIDRIDNTGNYCKENCRRATYKQQARNTRSNVTYKWKCLMEWSELVWINYMTLKSRIQKYWRTRERSLNEPVRNNQ
jgi:hypothetical protein